MTLRFPSPAAARLSPPELDLAQDGSVAQAYTFPNETGETS